MAAACRCIPEGRVVAEGTEVVEAAVGLLRPHVRRPEARDHAAGYPRGLIAGVGRKNGRPLAGQGGHALLKDQLELVKVRQPDGPSRYPIKPLESEF